MNTRIELHQLPLGLLDGLFKTEIYLKNSGFDQKLTELIKYRVSQKRFSIRPTNGCIRLQ